MQAAVDLSAGYATAELTSVFLDVFDVEDGVGAACLGDPTVGVYAGAGVHQEDGHSDFRAFAQLLLCGVDGSHPTGGDCGASFGFPFGVECPFAVLAFDEAFGVGRGVALGDGDVGEDVAEG